MIRPCMVLCIAAGLVGGCGNLFGGFTPLLTAPLVVNGEPVDPAIVDTGGGYELMLRERFGLDIVDTVEVLAFGGRELVGLTEGFPYEVGGVAATAEVALVGISACDCNGVGFFFFRKTGVTVEMDFSRQRVTFVTGPPTGGVALPFEPPPPWMQNFDSAFVTVEVTTDGASREVLGLLDTGTNSTVMRRDLLGDGSRLFPNRLSVTIRHEALGAVEARVTLFDTPGLPDLIIGVDVMRAWADRWYFRFYPRGGIVTVFPQEPPLEAGALAALRLVLPAENP